MQKYSTILFDFDGTIAHSESAILDAIRDSVTHHGFDYEKHRETFAHRIGLPMIDVYTELFGAEKAKQIRKTHIDIQHKHFHKYTLLDGAIDTLKILKKHKISTAIVTSANRPKMEALIAVLKLSDYFDYLVTIDDVMDAKPHPEGILKAMKELHAQPDSTLMVGDSEADINAASQAGIDSVLLSTDVVKLHHLSSTYTIQQFDQLLPIVGVQ